jgi:hypothetical protein
MGYWRRALRFYRLRFVLCWCAITRIRQRNSTVYQILKETMKSKTKPRSHRVAEKLRCPICHTIAVEGRCRAAACPANELKDIDRDSPRTTTSTSRKRSRSPRVESTGCDESPPPKNDDGDDEAKPAKTLLPHIAETAPALPTSNSKLRMITSLDAHRAELKANSVSDCHGIVVGPTIGMKCYFCIGSNCFVPAEIVEVKDRGHVTVRLFDNLGIKTRSSFLRTHRSAPKVTPIQPETVATEILFSTEM